ncbi:MAG: HyaD/HybD family hydrogenase maturation endopeptidase [Hyphomicrobiales bacterium]|nr:HyaD/HybD family hydrogenase maturation endopeptidase [Hyphomicrobiales bacterium]MDE2115394.1 HyaD/HybD family hydrogenase maturation endopeptidase [Hyphomicrobiales bacterium]
MQADLATPSTLILGIGNILLTDDGIGIHVIHALQAMARDGGMPFAVSLRDGGTIGLALLSEIEDCGAMIALDAMELGAPPGTVRSFEGAAMDAQLGGNKSTAHEVALADLMTAAQLAGYAPARRALIGIQPGSTQWGLTPTDAVSQAVPLACDIVVSLMGRWSHIP